MNLWTSEDIAKILIQLDEMKLPFSKYALIQEDGRLNLLGRGGSAEVYEAMTCSTKKDKYALKVIGFRNQNIDSEFFNESVQVQKDIGDFQDNVVTIYDHTELWITLDEKDNVVSAEKEKPEVISRTTIQLQFILMEKISSVISRTKDGNIKMLPEQLAYANEEEILKLAYDVGLALKRAHKKNILHRDVKLENVFYSEKKKQYKLGDFGIAKKTEDGFAGTIAFTKGYAAPEVRASDDRYDNTADIYSFGMMLYVLANNLKFPDSNTYNVNSYIQYMPGYVVAEPEGNISAGLYYVISKACMYDPDERYQSMDDMLLDIEKLMYSFSLGYRKEHKNSSLVVGTILLAIGVVAWKLTMAPMLVISVSLWEYVFLIGCLSKGVLKAFKKDVILVSLGILGVGIYLFICSGFSWLKLVFLLWMTFSSGTSEGYLSAGILIANMVSLIQGAYVVGWNQYNEYSWVAVTVISIALVLIWQYEILSMEDRKTAQLYYKKGFYWIAVVLIYASLLLTGMVANLAGERLFRAIFGNTIADMFFSFDMKMTGLYGLGFCLFWIGREKLLMYKQKKQIQRMNEQYENE